jgi:L-threonylcarbamoyladenylate synthase
MYQTELLSDSPAGHERAASLLRQGHTVVIPTETVYGLAAAANQEQAVAAIFTAKGRPADNPLIVHIADFHDLEQAALPPSPAELVLLRTFCPGPLTLILKRQPSLAQAVTAGLSTVGVRIPAEPVARKIIKLSACPLAAPSANRSGRPSPTNFAMAQVEMQGRVAAIVQGPQSTIGLESTIVWLNQGVIHLLRPGSISAQAIERSLQDHGFAYRLNGATSKTSHTPASPGSRYTHYAPNARVHLRLPHEASRLSPGAKRLIIHEILAPQDYARHLYHCLADADRLGLEDIELPFPDSLDPMDPEAGIVEALRDRLRRAAGLV